MTSYLPKLLAGVVLAAMGFNSSALGSRSRIPKGWRSVALCQAAVAPSRSVPVADAAPAVVCC